MSELKLVKRESKPRYYGFVAGTKKDDYAALLGLSPAERCLISMTEQEAAFCCNMVLNGLDKVKAYKEVYAIQEMEKDDYKKIAALLAREDVRQMLRMGVKTKMREIMDNLDSKLLDTYTQRAFYDISDFHDMNGMPKPLSEIPEEKRCAIDKIEIKYYGRDGDVCSVNYVLANRDVALKTLTDYVNEVRPNTDIAVTSTAFDDISDEDEAERIANMSDEELQAEIRRLG